MTEDEDTPTERYCLDCGYDGPHSCTAAYETVTMKIYKFLVSQDYPVVVGTVVYSDCLAIVLAHDVPEARKIAKDFLANHKDPYASRAIDSAWLDYVEPEEFSLDNPCAIGATLG